MKSIENFQYELIEAYNRGLVPLEREFRMLSKCGQIVWIHGYYTLQRSASGNPEYIIGVLKDITEIKKMKPD